jgi:hypothetical protein
MRFLLDEFPQRNSAAAAPAPELNREIRTDTSRRL